MITYTPEHIQECAKFIEENCYEPDVLFNSRLYATSDIYKTILASYCRKLATSMELVPIHNETDLYDPHLYAEKWHFLNRQSHLSLKHKKDALDTFITKNESKYNLIIQIMCHSQKHSADVYVKQIENIVEINNNKIGFNLDRIQVFEYTNGQWQKAFSNRHLIKLWAECMAEPLITAILTENSEIFMIYLPSLYNDHEDFVPEPDNIKLNVFRLYARVKNIELPSDKIPIIKLAIDMHLTLEQTLDMYAKSFDKIESFNYPELN